MPAARHPLCRLGGSESALVVLSPPVYSQQSIMRSGPVMGSMWSGCASLASSLAPTTRPAHHELQLHCAGRPLCPGQLGRGWTSGKPDLDRSMSRSSMLQDTITCVQKEVWHLLLIRPAGNDAVGSCQGCCRPDCRFTCIQHVAGRTQMPNVLLTGDAR